MEESGKKEILHQVKREIYHIKKVTVHTAQQDGEISDPDIAIADTTVKRSQQAAYHLAARTGKLIFQTHWYDFIQMLFRQHIFLSFRDKQFLLYDLLRIFCQDKIHVIKIIGFRHQNAEKR